MNPKRWKWYTWLSLLYFAGVFYATFSSVADGMISVLVAAAAWLFLKAIDWFVRAVYHDFKHWPPTERPH